MLTIFNRTELITVFSMKRLYALQAALDAAGIPYHTKAATPLGRIGGRNRGSVFQEPDSAHDFKIYVQQNDYHRAMAAIQDTLRNS